MRIRVRFEKQGISRFMGHLDVMRYFQKLNRRAGLDMKYSAGFSPHQEMSFATPLGLGILSRAEYVDIEMNSLPPCAELIERMNAVSIPEIRVNDAVLLPDGAKNAMSLLAAADYRLTFRERKEPEDPAAFIDEILAFLSSESIVVLKETKKSSRLTDIRKEIRSASREGSALLMTLDTGSASNLKPELVLKGFFESRGEAYDPFLFETERTELYGEEDGKLVRLIDYGTHWK